MCLGRFDSIRNQWTVDSYKIKYYAILEVGGSVKREKSTTTNNNNMRTTEINGMNEPTYEDIERMEQDDDDEEDE